MVWKRFKELFPKTGPSHLSKCPDCGELFLSRSDMNYHHDREHR